MMPTFSANGDLLGWKCLDASCSWESRLLPGRMCDRVFQLFWLDAQESYAQHSVQCPILRTGPKLTGSICKHPGCGKHLARAQSTECFITARQGACGKRGYESFSPGNTTAARRLDPDDVLAIHGGGASWVSRNID